MARLSLCTALPPSAVTIVDCSFQGFQFFWLCPVPIENELQGSLFCAAKTLTPKTITWTLACIFEYEMSELQSCPS
uniref:Putative secreted protein n=1 Tax=Ixodes ricinus TaxID=34613 RepID=A0A6B0TVT4_IXORI